MLSTIAAVELEVLRMMSAPPAAVRPFPSRTISSAPSSRILLSLSGESEIATVPKPTDSKYGHALVRLRIGPAEPAINSISGAKDWCSLLVGNLVRNQIRSVGVHQHVLGVPALCICPGALQIGTEHPSAALAPFAASAGGLNPRRANAVAYLASGHIRSRGDDLAHRLVTKDSRKWSRKVSKRLVHIGVAD